MQTDPTSHIVGGRLKPEIRTSTKTGTKEECSHTRDKHKKTENTHAQSGPMTTTELFMLVALAKQARQGRAQEKDISFSCACACAYLMHVHTGIFPRLSLFSCLFIFNKCDPGLKEVMNSGTAILAMRVRRRFHVANIVVAPCKWAQQSASPITAEH